MLDIKKCGLCGIQRQLHSFPENSRESGGLKGFCLDCEEDYNNPGRVLRYWTYTKGGQDHRNRIKRINGLDPKVHIRIYVEQMGYCMDCTESQLNKIVFVRRDSETSEILGLVCRKCSMKGAQNETV